MAVRGTVCLAAFIAALLTVTSLDGQGLAVRTFTTADGLPTNSFRCMFGDRRGFVWLCSDQGLVRFDGETAVTFGREAGLDSPQIDTLLQANARFWVGGPSGLYSS